MFKPTGTAAAVNGRATLWLLVNVFNVSDISMHAARCFQGLFHVL
jgi:hypothetical protein